MSYYGKEEHQQNKSGWDREIVNYETGDKYVCDSKLEIIDGKASLLVHEYNISPDETEHSHVVSRNGQFLGGHESDERNWHW